jgi:hypothetical protein
MAPGHPIGRARVRAAGRNLRLRRVLEVAPAQSAEYGLPGLGPRARAAQALAAQAVQTLAAVVAGAEGMAKAALRKEGPMGTRGAWLKAL